jgi:tyrosyl-tRNA synthetase
MSVFEELKSRGLIAQTTHEDKIKDLLENQKITFYIGFDPTADSLHVGHFLQLMVMAHMQRAGHKPIAILGGGTAMVGDPSGRTDMRQMMSASTINSNIEIFKKQMSHFIDFSEDKALMVNNADWLLHLNYVDFLREVGVHFSVNKMLTADCFKSRLERGLNFIEFNYMIMQSYDFLRLFKDYNCIMQLGGDDQWANILGGIELIRRTSQKESYGMTFTLLTTSEGKKMGKTQNGAVWLDAQKTTPYEFYQYWRNVDDADVIKFLKLITFVPLEQIYELAKLEGSELNKAKEILAFEVTKLVHGEQEAIKAQETTRALFGAKADSANMPSTELTESDFSDGKITIAELLVKASLTASRSEAKRLIEQGGICVNDEKIIALNKEYSIEQIKSGLIVKKGKKVFHRIIIQL